MNMKKLMFFLVAMICWQYLYGQKPSIKEADNAMANLAGPNAFVSNSFDTNGHTEDVAYEAPNSALTKKWFFRNVNEYRENPKGYIIFYPNGTLKMCWDFISFYSETPGRWNRTKQTLKMTFNFNLIKGFDYDLSGYSLRQKDGFKKNKQETLSGIRKGGTLTEKHTILRLDDFMVLDNKDGLFSCYLVSEDWVINKIKAEKEEETKKAEEEKIRAEEEKIRAEEEKKAAEENKKRIELVNLNTQAYKYAYEGKFDDAISTIEKAIEQQPNNANWYDSKGEILYLKGDKDGAKAMWDKAISVDPNFKNNASALKFLINDKGWKFVKSDFPIYVPFKKIRVKTASKVPGGYCCVFFTKEPGSNRAQQDTKYGINYYLSGIYNGENYYDKKIKKCTDVGDGWYEYEYSQYMYFSHYQKNAPKDCLQILIE